MKTKHKEILNFLYFIHNFDIEVLYKCIDATAAPTHLKEKLMNKHARTESFVLRPSTIIEWFMELDVNNMDAFLTAVHENYQAFKWEEV